MRKSKYIEHENELWKLLYRAAYAIRRSRESELLKHGVSWIQSSVLYAVNSSEVPPTPADISRSLFRKAHTVSGLLDRMEKQGLITKARDEKKKNRVRILLTDKGEELDRKARESIVIHEVMSCLSKRSQDSLRASLEKLYDKALEVRRTLYKLPFP